MPDVYQFGDCELAQAKRSLLSAGRDVPVQPKVLDLLVLLLRYRDQVLSKADLKASLWPDVSVSDAALTRLVKEARRAVGDDGARQRVIKTVQRRGYRFVAEVRIGGGDDRREGGRTHLSAAAEALGREAHAEAEWYYRRAIALLSDRNTGHASLLFEALLSLAETQRQSPSGAVDRAMLQRAVAVARVHGLWNDYARAALALAGDGPNWRLNPDLLTLLHDAHERAADPVLRARLLARAATEHSVDPFSPEARDLRAAALSGAGESGPLALLALVGGRHDWVWQGVAPSQRSEAVDAMVAAASATGDVARVLTAQLVQLRELLEVGDVAGFDRVAAAIERSATGAANRQYRYRLDRLRIARATMAGQFGVAEDLLDDVANPPCGYGIGDVWDDHTAQVASLLAARERMHEIGPVCGPGSHGSVAVTARCIQLWLDACRTEHVQARYELRKLLPVGDLALLHPADAAIVAASCALLEQPGPAEALERALAPLTGRNVLRGDLVCYGPCDYFLGVLAQLRGDPDRAVALFVRAEQLADASGATLALVRVRLHLATLSTREDRARLVRSALDDAERVGLEQAGAYARSLLAEPAAR